jgi:hypothetical protein
MNDLSMLDSRLPKKSVDEMMVLGHPVENKHGLKSAVLVERARRRPAGTTTDVARIPIAQAAAAKTTTRSPLEIILVVGPCWSFADRSILSVARIPLDLTSPRGCPTSRLAATRHDASRCNSHTRRRLFIGDRRLDYRQDRDEISRCLQSDFHRMRREFYTSLKTKNRSRRKNVIFR